MFEMAALILNGSGGDSVVVAGVGSGSGSGSWETTASLASLSAIGSNWLSVVNWKMGTAAPLSGVIPTGGSDGLRWGVSIQSFPSSMWFVCDCYAVAVVGCSAFPPVALVCVLRLVACGCSY